jgi:c-di-AMP phosphodiesterase-like protein
MNILGDEQPTLGMKWTILAICSILILTVSLCLAQESLSQQITNWGNEINGVQMSISTSNDTVLVGSNIVVKTFVQNNSTNIIWLNPPTRTSFSLESV